ncbi:MAG: hypothetical protein AB1505_13810 [Candidatus Latescibacterota bacterium]
MHPFVPAHPETASGTCAPAAWARCALCAGVAWLPWAGCSAGDPDVVPEPVRIVLTGTMVSGHGLSEALGVRRSALVDMDGVVTCQVWLRKGDVERICGQLAVVEAGVSIHACDWEGADEGDGPDGQADEVRISRKDPGSDQSTQIAAVENYTDAARYPSRVEAGNWVIQLAGRAYEASR